MISHFIEKQQKQKMESNWFKQSQHLKENTIKKLIQHEKELQQEINQKQLLVEKQLETEQQLSKEKETQLKLEKEKLEIIKYANNIVLLKERIDSLMQINKQLQEENLEKLNKIKQQQEQLHYEEKKQQVKQDKIHQLEYLLDNKDNKDNQFIIGQQDTLIKNSLTINNIPTLHIIYQYSYKNNMKVTGFGDFIRGCFYILQFSDKYKINVDFNIFKHPLKQYLEYFSCKKDIHEYISNNIIFFKDENHNYYKSPNNTIYYIYQDIDHILLNFIKETNDYNQHKYLYLTNHPDETKITENNKQNIRELLKPTQYLLNEVESSMLNLKLIKHKYTIIHIRIQDQSFYKNNPIINNRYISNIVNHINNIKKNTDSPILLIANNNNIKSAIINKIPDIKTIFHEITHIADKLITNDNNLINTLKEFYIMSYSSHIYSFSVYDHGSGFSKWCSVAYNIPYVCFSLQ